MSSITETFRACHRLRKHLRDLQIEIDRGPRVLKSRQETLVTERQTHKDHHDAITQLKLKQRADEVSLKETETRLTKLEAQLLNIGVAKEIAAKESEIAQARAKKDDLEDTILGTISDIEEKNAAVPAVDKRWADAQTDFVEYQKEAAERLERLQSDQVHCRATLLKHEAEIPEVVRGKYDTLVKAHGPEAMASVKNRSCQGCHTGLADQRLNELQNHGFMLCPNCGKMLYLAE